MISARSLILASAGLAILALVGCASSSRVQPTSSPGEPAGAAAKTSSALHDPAGNVVLFVDNGSIPGEALDIIVEIDGEAVVDGVFPSASDSNVQPSPEQGYYVLRLPAGRHTISAHSDKGEVSLEKSFEIAGKLWIAVAYSYNTSQYGTPSPRQFNIVISEEETGRL